MKPMLAWRTKPSKLTIPCFLQRKYNGLRGMWMPEHQTLQSRDELLYEPAVIKHLLTELTSLPFVVDGEIYTHGMSLQDINSRMGVNRKGAHNDATAVGYVIFDIPSMKPFWQRAKDLEKLEMWLERSHRDVSFVQVAPTVEVTSQAEADYYYNQWRQEGYEGAMYKLPEAPYGFAEHCGNKENRWWHIQKRKGTEDLQAKIINLNEGAAGFSGMLGAFECEYTHPDDRGIVRFYAGSGLNFDQRQRYWNDPNCVLGQPIDIEFEMFSDGGIPLKPIVTLVHEAY